MNSSVVTCAELRVIDPSVWLQALAASGTPIMNDLRLSLEDVAEFFIVACLDFVRYWGIGRACGAAKIDPLGAQYS
jgi:hypothetical protein